MSSSSYTLRDLIKRKWQRLASSSSRSEHNKNDGDDNEKRRSKGGHFVVYAREGRRRFVVPLKYLDHPIFRVLLEMAEEEFGSMACGPLRVPCEEELMDHIVSLLGMIMMTRTSNPSPRVDHHELLSIASCRPGAAAAPLFSSLFTSPSSSSALL